MTATHKVTSDSDETRRDETRWFFISTTGGINLLKVSIPGLISVHELSWFLKQGSSRMNSPKFKMSCIIVNENWLELRLTHEKLYFNTLLSKLINQGAQFA